jgi:hypothetical protein
MNAHAIRIFLLVKLILPVCVNYARFDVYNAIGLNVFIITNCNLYRFAIENCAAVLNTCCFQSNQINSAGALQTVQY